MTCNYCGDEREDMEGWHTCTQARDARLRMEASLEAIMRIAEGRPDLTPKTSEEMKFTADRRRDMSTSIRLTGGQVRPEYEAIDE